MDQSLLSKFTDYLVSHNFNYLVVVVVVVVVMLYVHVFFFIPLLSLVLW